MSDETEHFFRSIRNAFIIITAVFFLTLLGFAWVIIQLQESRESSCKTTYNGIHDVFLPFFPPQPRTTKQQEDIDKFEAKIVELRTECEEQVDLLP
jgi:hypothetical protein